MTVSRERNVRRSCWRSATASRRPCGWRQYWPPGCSAESISTTSHPDHEAAAAAARPAGPAPTTTTSYREFATTGPFLSAYCHAGLRGHDACTAVRTTVDDDEAVEADPDPTEESSRLGIAPRGSPRHNAVGDQRRRDALAWHERHRTSVEDERLARASLGRLVARAAGRTRPLARASLGRLVAHSNRSGRKASTSTSGRSPASNPAGTCPGAAARPTPAPSWPHAW